MSAVRSLSGAKPTYLLRGPRAEFDPHATLGLVPTAVLPIRFNYRTGQIGRRRMKIDGGCHCGEITYQAEVEPNSVSICHCTDCQKGGGSAFRANVAAPASSFELRSGTPNRYVKTAAQSGRRIQIVFCGNCGSPLWSSLAENPTVYRLRLGSIEQRAALSPQRQMWKRSALPWIDALTTVPSFDENPPELK